MSVRATNQAIGAATAAEIAARRDDQADPERRGKRIIGHEPGKVRAGESAVLVGQSEEGKPGERQRDEKAEEQTARDQHRAGNVEPGRRPGTRKRRTGCGKRLARRHGCGRPALQVPKALA